MKKKFLLLLVLINSVRVSAQEHAQEKIDSLHLVLAHSANDSNAMKTLMELGNCFYPADSMLYYGDMALKLAKKINFKKGEAKAYRFCGSYYEEQGNYQKALDYYSNALELAQQLQDLFLIGSMYKYMGNVYQGDVSKALDSYFNALEAFEKIDTRRLTAPEKNKVRGEIARIHNHLGNVYRGAIGDLDQGLKHYSEGLKIFSELGDSNGVAVIYGNLGNLYSNQAEHDSVHANELNDKALQSYLKAIEINEAVGNDNSINFCNIADNYRTQSETTHDAAEKKRLLALSLDYNNKALQSAEKNSNKELMANILLNLGLYYESINMHREAESQFKKALSVSESLGDMVLIKNSNESLTQLYDSTGQYKLALDYYKKFIAVRDTITNEENTKKQTRTELQYEFNKKEAVAQAEQEKKDIRQRTIRNSIALVLGGTLMFLIVVYRQRNKISKARKRSDELLLNILPEETADELKSTGQAQAKHFDQVTVMFTDFKNFTQATEKLSAVELVKEIHECYSAFDKIITKYGLEKIKTIGDSYMCAGGLPVPNKTNAEDIVSAALEICDFMRQEKEKREAEGKPFFEIRIGCHTGPVVAGIVGIKKFAYDIWGDTVNIAARMEQNSEAGKINISGTTYELVKDKFKCVHRGKVEAKNKGQIDMYFMDAKSSPYKTGNGLPYGLESISG